MANPNAPEEMTETTKAIRKGFGGSDLGVHMVVCVLVAGGAGYALDQWLGWQPWGMLAGGLLGFAAWLNVVIRMK